MDHILDKQPPRKGAAIAALEKSLRSAERGLTLAIAAYPIALTGGTLGAAARYYMTGATPDHFAAHAVAAWGLASWPGAIASLVLGAITWRIARAWGLT